MRAAEDLRLAIETFTHAHGSFGLHMAKRVEPSDAEHGSHVDHGAHRL